MSYRTSFCFDKLLFWVIELVFVSINDLISIDMNVNLALVETKLQFFSIRVLKKSSQHTKKSSFFGTKHIFFHPHYFLAMQNLWISLCFLHVAHSWKTKHTWALTIETKKNVLENFSLKTHIEYFEPDFLPKNYDQRSQYCKCCQQQK